MEMRQGEHGGVSPCRQSRFAGWAGALFVESAFG